MKNKHMKPLPTVDPACAVGMELDENVAALRRMRVIAWLFAAFIFGGLCLWAGLYIGSTIGG